MRRSVRCRAFSAQTGRGLLPRPRPGLICPGLAWRRPFRPQEGPHAVSANLPFLLAFMCTICDICVEVFFKPRARRPFPFCWSLC